jgi:hypothetical protein
MILQLISSSSFAYTSVSLALIELEVRWEGYVECTGLINTLTLLVKKKD